MKPLIFATVFVCSLFGASETFLLPDNTADALYGLKKAIGSAEKNITLITPDLQSPTIKKALVNVLEHNVFVTIITQKGEPGDAVSLVQFRQMEVMGVQGLHSDYESGRLMLSLLIIDNRQTCISTIAFNERMMKHHIGIIECTDDPKRLKSYQNYATTLKERADPYLN